jgi:hypothetical protein
MDMRDLIREFNNKVFDLVCDYDIGTITKSQFKSKLSQLISKYGVSKEYALDTVRVSFESMKHNLALSEQYR